LFLFSLLSRFSLPSSSIFLEGDEQTKQRRARENGKRGERRGKGREGCEGSERRQERQKCGAREREREERGGEKDIIEREWRDG
jgi:hypothetical protein